MVVAALWLVLFGVLDAIPGLIVISLFGAAPLIVATAADERRTAIFAGATVMLAIVAGWWDGVTDDMNYWTRFAAVCVISAMAIMVAGMRRRRELAAGTYDRRRAGHPTGAASASAPGDDRDQHRGPLPLGGPRGLGRR
jgi:drug/metabolite transporter superfamily protein YnfA